MARACRRRTEKEKKKRRKDDVARSVSAISTVCMKAVTVPEVTESVEMAEI